jgi:hypothetical protein
MQRFQRLNENMFNNRLNIEVLDLTDVPVSVCIENDKKRIGTPGYVGEKVIFDTYYKFLYKKVTPEYLPNVQNIILCDIDGTVAQHHDRSPYDTSKCYEDTVITHVVDVIKSLMLMNDLKLIFFSGREDKSYEMTRGWLMDKARFSPHSFELYMRKTGDSRSDYIVKKELYDEHVKGKYNVHSVFDDRPQVIIDCWQKLGLPIFNCGLLGRWF